MLSKLRSATRIRANRGFRGLARALLAHSLDVGLKTGANAAAAVGILHPKGEAKDLEELAEKYRGEYAENDRILRLLHYEVLTEYITELDLDDDARICDVATGRGYLLRNLSELGYTDLTGVDRYAPEELTPRRHTESRILDGVDHEFVITDLNEYGLEAFESNQFDLVVSSETIEHVRNPCNFVQELTRVADHDGVILLTTPNVESLQERLRFFLTGEFNLFPEITASEVETGAGHVSIVTDSILRSILKTTDYEVHDEFGGYVQFRRPHDVPFGGKRVGHHLSYAKGYDIRTADTDE